MIGKTEDAGIRKVLEEPGEVGSKWPKFGRQEQAVHDILAFQHLKTCRLLFTESIVSYKKLQD